jgi:hypothetical protein
MLILLILFGAAGILVGYMGGRIDRDYHRFKK